MKIKVSGPVKALLKLGFTIAALWFVFSKIPFKEVLDSLQGLSPWPLFPAVIAFILSKYLSAVRLRRFFQATGIPIGAVFNLKLYLLGMFYNLFLPGGIGGDGYKIYLLNRRFGVRATRILWTVLADRASGLLALLVLGVGLYYLTPLRAGAFHGWIWFLAPLALAAAYLLLWKLLPSLRLLYVPTTLYSLGVQVAQILSAWLILTAIGSGGNPTGYLFLFLVSSIVAMLPITVGGVGTRELTFLLGSGMLGLDTGVAVGLSLMFYLISLLVSFCGIYYLLRPGELRLGPDTSD